MGRLLCLGKVIVPSLIVLIVAEPKSIWDKVKLGSEMDKVPKAEVFKNLRLFIGIRTTPKGGGREY